MKVNQEINTKEQENNILLNEITDNSIEIKIIDDIKNLINESVKKRLENLPILAEYYHHKNFNQENLIKFFENFEKNINSNSIAVLFSGGIDSSILAYFVALNIPDNLDINLDLFNISFGKGAPDRNSGLIAYYEIKKIFPNKKINLYLIDKDYNEDVLTRELEIMSLIFPKQTHMDFNISTALNLATKLEGYLVNYNSFGEFMEKYISDVLKIDNTEKIRNNYSNDILSKKITTIDYENFLEKEVDDFNNGKIITEKIYKNKLFKSNSKIIFSGLGADEFFGGYARYKTSWEKGNENGLFMEMSKDINRVWVRNFGRDDRACSDNGIELRFPFFDLDLLEYLSKVEKIEYITDFTKSRGTGEKIVLRKICEKIGFRISHNFEKRAIQFGTRLAKETNINKYGSNRKANGKAQYK